MQKPRVTEIHVRMNCNGCVQKIKKALCGINGIYDLYIDFPQQTSNNNWDPKRNPPKDTPPLEQPRPEATPSPKDAENNQNQQSPRTKDAGEVHMMHHNPPNYGNRLCYGGHNYVEQLGDRYHHNNPTFLQEPPQPVYVTHSYNTYRPSPYVTEYEYVRSPSRLTHYNRVEHYSGDYQYGNGNITSMFSDENPNACRIV
ncbi:hypothetical protein VNO78_04665 [Psophocarpus tetragonolobus]|uniref:HMA domain-containing protein n=1 Tax=Psophocarpus tetragonolobus TaxID=3891 RepID=A0AAN9T601_PSOTE